MSKKFNDYMAYGYTIVFAVGFAVISSIVFHVIGLEQFEFLKVLYETIYAVAIATLFTMLIPIFGLADAFARLCHAQAPSRKYILCVSAVACSIYVPIICFFMMLLRNYPNFTPMIFVMWLMFIGPFFVGGLILAQLFGGLIFKVVVNMLGEEAMEQPKSPAGAGHEKPEAAAGMEPLDLNNGEPFSGRWTVINVSPAGKNTLEFRMSQKGGTLNGVVAMGDGTQCPISEGVVEGDRFCFKVSLKLPFGMLPFEMSGAFDGATLKGESKMLQNGAVTPLEGTKN